MTTTWGRPISLGALVVVSVLAAGSGGAVPVSGGPTDVTGPGSATGVTSPGSAAETGPAGQAAAHDSVAALAAGNVNASEASRAADEPGYREILVTVHIDRTPETTGSVRVTFDVRAGDAVTEFRLSQIARFSDRLQLVSADGFEQTDSDPLTFTTDPEPDESSQVVIDVSLPDSREVSRAGVDNRDWSLVSLRYHPSYRFVSEDSPRVRTEVTFEGEGTAVTGPSYVTAFLGDHEATTRTMAGQEFTLVEPGGLEITSDREAVFRAMDTASHSLRVGERDREVMIVPMANPGTTSASGWGGDNYLQANANADALAVEENTYVHEYVHTRQAFGTTDPSEELEWFIEGSASYYDTTIPVTFPNGTGNYTDARNDFTGETDAGTLSRPDTWSSDQVEYGRGSQAVAVLNQRIFEATDGRQTALSVIRHLNERAQRLEESDEERDLTGEDLRWAIRESGLDPDDWYDAYVDGTEPIEPTSPWAYVVSARGDPDGDGLTNSQEYRADADLHPFRADSDSDGTPDGEAVEAPPTLTPEPEITAEPTPGPATESGGGGDGQGGEDEPDIQVTVSGPGFTVPATLVALVVALLLARRRS